MVPTGITSTGWPSVCRTCTDKLGIEFDDWQHGAGRVILAKRADGTLAAMIDGVGMSLPRQVGKTYLVGAIVFALCVNIPGLLVIWSAHHARTHGETFLAMQGMAERARIKPHVRQVFQGSGDEEIRFHNRSRILFGARERGFGRGIPGVDVLIFDEAQILTDRALSNMLATLNTSRFGLQLYIGTPPRPEDPSEAFTRMRTEAAAGTLTDGAWIEFGADEGADGEDRKQWAKANPSYPKRTPPQSMQRLKRKLKPDDWLREGMGVWDSDSNPGVFSLEAWQDLADDKSGTDSPVAFAVAVSPDRRWSAIGVAGPARRSKRLHVELVDRREGVDWLLARCIELRQKTRRARWVVDDHGPAASLLQSLKQAKVPVIPMTTPDVADATEAFIDGVPKRRFVHGPQPEVDDAIKALKLRSIGDGRSAFGRKASTADITAFEVLPLAVWGVDRPRPRPRVINLNAVAEAMRDEELAEDGHP